MQVDLDAAATQRLMLLAEASGYDDVRRYAADQLAAVAALATPEELAPLNEAELEASLAMLQASEEDVAAGRVTPWREALAEVAERHGLSGPR